MNRGIWDEETQEAYKAMSEYQKAFIRYKKATPSVEGSKQSFDLAKERLQQALNDPIVERHINSVMESGQENIRQIVVKEHEREIELNLSHFFGLKTRQTKKIFKFNDTPLTDGLNMKNSADLVDKIESLHRSIIKEVEKTRKTPERIPKKKRKTQISLGVTSLIFGSGCSIANSYFFPAFPPVAVSYATALTAWHQAVRDIIGEREE